MEDLKEFAIDELISDVSDKVSELEGELDRLEIYRIKDIILYSCINPLKKSIYKSLTNDLLNSLFNKEIDAINYEELRNSLNKEIDLYSELLKDLKLKQKEFGFTGEDDFTVQTYIN